MVCCANIFDYGTLTHKIQPTKIVHSTHSMQMPPESFMYAKMLLGLTS